MADPTDVLVFDTGPLSHFAQQGWLGILRLVVGDRTAVIPDTVVEELRAGIQGHAHPQLVLETSWIEHRVLISEDELNEFAGRKIAHANGVQHSGTLGLLCEAHREGLLPIDLISTVADHLLESEYRLPFRKGGFRKWAHDQGLVLPVD